MRNPLAFLASAVMLAFCLSCGGGVEVPNRIELNFSPPGISGDRGIFAEYSDDVFFAKSENRTYAKSLRGQYEVFIKGGLSEPAFSKGSDSQDFISAHWDETQGEWIVATSYDDNLSNWNLCYGALSDGEELSSFECVRIGHDDINANGSKAVKSDNEMVASEGEPGAGIRNIDCTVYELEDDSNGQYVRHKWWYAKYTNVCLKHSKTSNRDDDMNGIEPEIYARRYVVGLSMSEMLDDMRGRASAPDFSEWP